MIIEIIARLIFLHIVIVVITTVRSNFIRPLDVILIKIFFIVILRCIVDLYIDLYKILDLVSVV